jgi:hypothetical protein
MGCVTLEAPVIPPRGILFTHFKAPLDLNFKNTDLGKKRGIGETMWIKEPFFGTTWGFGNVAIKNAAAEYGINEMDYVDYEYMNVLGVFQEVKIIPHGK